MRILIVDDSTLFRKVVRDALATCPGIELVGVAADGKMALQKIRQYHPDVVTLDVEMPVLDGMEVLRELKSCAERPEVIMLSGMTDHSASLTTQALRLGAFDFVLKPTNGSSFDESCQRLRADLVPKIKVLQERLGTKSKPEVEPELPDPPFIPPTNKTVFDASQVTAVCIGVSTGGPAALSTMLPNLSANLRVPLLIVQHMPPVFTRSLANDLNRSCKINVCEAEHGQEIVPGTAYIAPGGHQMKVAQQGPNRIIQITDDPPERSCRPSADYLFRSMAHVYGKHAMGVVMTGMGDDGTQGCRLLKRHGCMIVAQDEKSCVVFGMPRQVISAGLADKVAPLSELHDVVQGAGLQGAGKCR